jgi:hypothetical protein
LFNSYSLFLNKLHLFNRTQHLTQILSLSVSKFDCEGNIWNLNSSILGNHSSINTQFVKISIGIAF